MALPTTTVLNCLVTLDQAAAPYADVVQLNYPLAVIVRACDAIVASQFLALRTAGWRDARALVSDEGATDADEQPGPRHPRSAREDLRQRLAR